MKRIFCIGYNKTGTTSLQRFMEDEGFLVAPQRVFECNLFSYLAGHNDTFEYIIKNDYAYYEFFQDVPFSLPNFYRYIDETFPDSKFILTVRNDENEWYRSMVNSHKKAFKTDNPMKMTFVHEKWMYNYLVGAYGTPKHDPYNEKHLKNSYKNHILEVQEYFKDKEDKLLTLNLTDENCVNQLSQFLGIEFRNKKMYHLNKT